MIERTFPKPFAQAVVLWLIDEQGTHTFTTDGQRVVFSIADELVERVDRFVAQSFTWVPFGERVDGVERTALEGWLIDGGIPTRWVNGYVEIPYYHADRATERLKREGTL